MWNATEILCAIAQGDRGAAEQLLPLVYDELRRIAAHKMAQEKPGQTLQATALVHEAYLRLVGADKSRHWENRQHFLAAAAEAMRRILVDNARRKLRLKRGGGQVPLRLESVPVAVDGRSLDVLALDEALTKLARQHPDKAELVNLRYFAGLTGQEAAEVLGISTSTADRRWSYARAWLCREIRRGTHSDGE